MVLLVPTRASLLVPSLLLVTAGLAAVTTSSATAAEPSPSPVWDAVVGSNATFFDYGTTGDIDVHGANTYRAGSVVDPDEGSTSFVYDVRNAKGVRTFRDLGGDGIGAGATAVDAGAWGAVVAGTVSGEFTPGASAGSDDAWVRRYAPDGEVQWTTQFGTSDSDSVSDVVVLGDTVVAVGATGAGDGTLLYTLDLATGVASGPLVIDVPAQSASITALAVIGNDVVFSGTTNRDIDLDGSPSSSDYQWIGRLDGDDLTHVVWETNGPSGSQSGSPFGNPITVLGGNVYTSSLASSSTGYLTSFAGATGSRRWNKAIGLYQVALGLTSYRGAVVVGGLTAVGLAGGTPGYDSLLQGWSTAGKALWSTHVAEDRSNALVFLTDVAASPQAGLVGIGTSGDSASGSGAFSLFLTALRVRAPKATVKTTGGFKASAPTTVKRGKKAVAQVRLTNVGELADKLKLRGCATPNGMTMTIKAGKKNVSSKVRSGKYVTPSLAVGRSTTLTVELVGGTQLKQKTVECSFESSSVADPANTSTAVLTIVAKP